jgi:hypothetical protein
MAVLLCVAFDLEFRKEDFWREGCDTRINHLIPHYQITADPPICGATYWI